MAIHIKPSHEGKMHEDLGKAADSPITAKDIQREKAMGPAEKKRAVFAENAKHWHHSSHGHAGHSRHGS